MSGGFVMNEVNFSWGVPDAFWLLVEPLIPKTGRKTGKTYKRNAGGGRKPLPARKIFEAIHFVLRTRCKWHEIPKSLFGSPSAIHKHYIQWQRAGFFENFWNAGLAEHAEMAGIPWCWDRTEPATSDSDEGATVGEKSGDAVKKKRKSSGPATGQRKWRPAVAIRNREQTKLGEQQQK
jgi:transposase